MKLGIMMKTRDNKKHIDLCYMTLGSAFLRAMGSDNFERLYDLNTRLNTVRRYEARAKGIVNIKDLSLNERITMYMKIGE